MRKINRKRIAMAAALILGCMSVAAPVSGDANIAQGQVDPDWDDSGEAKTGTEAAGQEQKPVAEDTTQAPAEEAASPAVAETAQPTAEETVKKTRTWPEPDIRGFYPICQYDYHDFDYAGENGEVLNYCCLPAALGAVLNFIQAADHTPVDIVDESMPEVREWEAGSAELLVRAAGYYGLNITHVTRDMNEIIELLKQHQLMVLHVNGNYPYAASGHYTTAYGYNEASGKIQIAEVVDGQIHEFETELMEASLQEDGAYVFETPTDSRIFFEPNTAAYTGRPMLCNRVRAYGSKAKLTYTYYTDSNCTVLTGAKDGARGEGLSPAARGTYYIKVTLPSDGRFTGAEAVSTLTIQ